MTRAALATLALALAAHPAAAQLLPDGDCAGVYWDLTAAFESGDRIYARVLLTRAGPGDLNAAALGHWIDPQGVTTPFQNGRREGHFELDAPGERLRIGSTSLDLSGARHRLVIDNEKRGVRIRVEWAARDTNAVPRIERHAEGLSIAVVDLSGASLASVWRRGMYASRALRGYATLIRTRHAPCEREIARWRVDVHGLGPQGWLLVHQQLSSGKAFGFVDAPGTVAAGLDLALTGWRGDSPAESLPRRMSANGPVFGSIEIGATQLSIDPLEALPSLVRMLYWFGAQPRRVWAEATSQLTSGPGLAAFGDPPANLTNGAAIASFTFLHPPDDPNRSSPPDSGG